MILAIVVSHVVMFHRKIWPMHVAKSAAHLIALSRPGAS